MSNLIDKYLNGKKGSGLVQNAVKNAANITQNVVSNVKEKANAQANTPSLQTVPEMPKTPYMDLHEKGATMLRENAESQKKYLEDSYKEQVAGINKDYDRTANQAYILYKKNQNELPEQLSRLGLNGGASENAALKLQTAYGGNLADNEFNRDKALSDARTGYNSAVNDVETNLNQNIYNSYNTLAQKDTDYGIQQAGIAREEVKEANEKAIAQAKAAEVTEHNKQAYTQMAALKTQGYEVDVWTDADGKIYYNPLNNPKQEAQSLATANNQAQNAVAKLRKQGYDVLTWTDETGRLQYAEIGKLNANATALDKVNNPRQRAAAKLQAQGYKVYTWTDERGYFHYEKGELEDSSGSGSSGGNKKKGTGGGDGGDDDGGNPKKKKKVDNPKKKKKVDNYSSVWSAYYSNNTNALKTNIANAMLKDSSEESRNRMSARIQDAYEKGRITEAQAKELYKVLG